MKPERSADYHRYLAWHGYVSELIRKRALGKGHTRFEHPLTMAKWRRATRKPTAKL